MEPFTITLQAARVNAGLTQEKLAKLLGVHRTTLHNWETGKTSPDLTHLRRVSHITGIPMDYLFLPGVLPKVEDGPGEKGRGLRLEARGPAKATGPGRALGVVLGLALALGALGTLSPGRLWARAEESGGGGGGSGVLCTRYVCTERDPLNVRDGPSLHAPWVYRLDRGEAVTVHEIRNGWAYVERCGDYGWAWAAYLKESPPADKPAAQGLAADGLPEAWLAVEEEPEGPEALSLSHPFPDGPGAKGSNADGSPQRTR